MFQNTGQNVCNMIRCPRNTHPLFRSFGLGAETDSISGLTRSNITVELKKWYPATKLKNIEIVKAEASGEFEYRLDIEEV